VAARNEKIRKSPDYKLVHVEMELSHKFLLYLSVIRVQVGAYGHIPIPTIHRYNDVF
jgi:hypothetical protein